MLKVDEHFLYLKRFKLKLLTSQNRSILLAALFLMLTGNLSLFKRLLEVFSLSLGTLPFLLSLTAFFTITTVMFLLLVCYGRLTKWILAFFLLASSQAAYYMDQYGIVIDTVMFDNIMQTNLHEFSGLLSISLIFKTLLLGVIPAWLVIRYTGPAQDLRSELRSKFRLLVILSIALAIVIIPFIPEYTSFIKEDKRTRLLANPTYFSYSLVKYSWLKLKSSPVVALQKTAEDAVKTGTSSKNKLVILVVGETARADRFSLNGYPRETNPELKKEKLISFSNVTSCGTSTGESVPCMFSVLPRKKFNREKARHMENALDVLSRNGVRVLWRDNNSDSKDVATRVRYEDFKSSNFNTICENECRDIGMLEGLDQFIASESKTDILIVLHQMGNHGPEYYRRFPKEFEHFNPICMESQLKDCSKQAIDNAYDNAILYTDHFLAKSIQLLKQYDDKYQTAMIYISDHGESLGENGIYLHAAPYLQAPKEQTHIPAILWLGKNFDIPLSEIQHYRNHPWSHDDLFCTLLVGFNLKTHICGNWTTSLSTLTRSPLGL